VFRVKVSIFITSTHSRGSLLLLLLLLMSCPVVLVWSALVWSGRTMLTHAE
jgi:hypothetical protein